MTGEHHELRFQHGGAHDVRPHDNGSDSAGEASARTPGVVRLFWTARSAVVLCMALLASTTVIQCSASGSDRSDIGPTGGTSSGGRGSGGSSTGGRNSEGGLLIDVQAKDYTAEGFFIDDPPPQSCDGGGMAAHPGGTYECPGDKNLPGCPCTTEGATAACWPGYRRHRNRGNCADGQTTCVRTGENQLQWSDCLNYTGIDPGTKMPVGATGKQACLCFSGGFWQLDNTSPCFFCSPSCIAGFASGAVSTLQQGEAGTSARCPMTFAQPNEPWSRNRVTADCNGFFKLCYTLKAGDSTNPLPTDCVMQQVCTSGHYDGAGTGAGGADAPQEFPPLPSWITSGAQNDCARRFEDTGGYAEMTVEGESDECDKVPFKQFQRVRYCPISCNDPANAMRPECINCTNGGGGPF